MPNVGKIVAGVAKAATKKATQSVKVSSNVTVKAKPGKTISSAEEARLKNINKPTGKLKPKYQAQANKADAKLMKAASKPKPKTDTMYTQYGSKPGSYTKVSARELATREAAKRKYR
jgi:hypothetical protein